MIKSRVCVCVCVCVCLCSNCKDQTIKMWDVRTGLRSENAAAQLRGRVPSFSWDYRCVCVCVYVS